MISAVLLCKKGTMSQKSRFLFFVFCFFYGSVHAWSDPTDQEIKEGYAILVSDMVLSGAQVCHAACNEDLSCDKYDCTEIDGVNACMDPSNQVPYTACVGPHSCSEAAVCLQGESAQKLQDFVDHKEDKGFAVHVFSPDDWGGGVGDVAAENIRAMLQVKTPELNLKYLLLLGDPRTDSDLPMKKLWPRNNATEPWANNYEVPSDYYYGELDGNWDLDGDGKFGEFGNPNLIDLESSGDFAPNGSELLGVNRAYELKVGRIPVYSEFGVAALDHILTKTIAYQRASFESIDWRKATLLAAEGGNRFFFGELIRDQILIPNEFESYRVYDADCWNEVDLDANCLSSLTTLPDAMECSVANVVSGWNTLTPGSVFWLSHGSSSSAIPIMSTHAAENQLDDNYPVFTFQASCNNSTPEAVSNLSYTLLVNGGIATIGATRESHGPGSPWPSLQGGSDNASMGWEYARHIIELQENAGTAFFEIRRLNGFGKWWLWQNYAVFNLFGDPDVSLYDFAPVHSVDEISDQVVAEGESLTLTLSAYDDQGGPVEITVGTLEDWMTFDPDMGELTVSPGFDHAAVYTLNVESLGYGEKDQKTLILEVTNTNRPPSIIMDTAVNLTAGTTLELSITTEDPDGDDVSVSIGAEQDVSWASLTENVLVFSPGFDVRGDFQLSLVADDGEDSSELSLSLSVTAPPEDVTISEDASNEEDVSQTAVDNGPAPSSKKSSGCVASHGGSSSGTLLLWVAFMTLIASWRRRSYQSKRA